MNEDQKIQQEESETPGWLQKLQQESWQAEILISGGAFIAIVGLLNTMDSFYSFLEYATKLNHGIVLLLTGGIGLAILFLAEGFLLHLILRGYWIGLIGLNYVFPKGINQEKLAFRGRFSTFIKGNSNSPYLMKLDKLCSLVFAFTFFVIFSFAGFIIFIILSMLFSITATLIDLPNYISIPLRVFATIFLLLGIIVFIDFITFGRLKRTKWFSNVYYPIYYFMSRVTLSFLYRRLYYTIVSNIKPWYIILGLCVQIFISLLLEAGTSNLSKNISDQNSPQGWPFLSLKENVVTGKSLQFSITHIPRLEDELFEEWKKNKKGYFY